MAGNTMGTCPLGGLWYTCTAQTPTFMGCCTSNPCQGDGTGCPEEDLRAAGMGTGPGPNPDFTSNDVSYWPNVQCSVGEWYTCAAQTPSFQGCCETNPCGGSGTSCPSGSLHPAAFKTVPVDSATSSTSATDTRRATTTSGKNSIISSTLSTTSSATSSVLGSATASSASSSTGGSSVEKSGSGPSIGAIAGGAAGGVAVLVIGLLIFWFCKRRQKKKSALEPMIVVSPSEVLKHPGEPYNSGPLAKQAYYPNQPTLRGQNAAQYAPVPSGSPPISPGPPPYQSPQPSPNPNLHEIDSTHVHEADSAMSVFSSRNQNLRPVNHSRAGSGMQSTGWPADNIEAAELPHSPVLESRWRSRRPVGMADVEIGEGSPCSNMLTPVSDGTLSANENRREGRESYVSWQNLSS